MEELQKLAKTNIEELRSSSWALTFKLSNVRDWIRRGQKIVDRLEPSMKTYKGSELKLINSAKQVLRELQRYEEELSIEIKNIEIRSYCVVNERK
jgi:hypothetical protein